MCASNYMYLKKVESKIPKRLLTQNRPKKQKHPKNLSRILVVVVATSAQVNQPLVPVEAWRTKHY